MFVFSILEKIKETKIFSRTCNSIIKDDKLSRSKNKTNNIQLNKVISAAKIKQEKLEDE